jgi:hypothetical protein
MKAVSKPLSTEAQGFLPAPVLLDLAPNKPRTRPGPVRIRDRPYGEQDRDASRLQRYFLELLASSLAGNFPIHFDGFMKGFAQV